MDVMQFTHFSVKEFLSLATSSRVVSYRVRRQSNRRTENVDWQARSSNPQSSYQLELGSAVKAVLESITSARKDSVQILMWSFQTAEDASKPRVKGGAVHV